MSRKIEDRRIASASVPSEKRAVMVNAGKEKKSSAGKIILLVAVIIVALAAILFLVINALIKNVADTISPNGSYKDTIPSIAESYKDKSQIYQDKVTSDPDYLKYALLASNNHSDVVDEIKDTDNVFNYAIYGIEDADPSNPAADIIVIASINKDTNKLTYVLLDDETLVYIPYAEVVGYLKDAYNLGGSNLLSRTISQNFGVDIDGYVELKMSDAANMVKAVGDIEIAMTQEEVDALNESIALYNEKFGTEIQNVTKKGDNKIILDGERTLAYIRGKDGCDTKALFNVLAEVTKTAIEGGVSGVNALADKLAENAITSTNAADFSSLLMIIAKTAKGNIADNMVTITLGTEDAVWVWICDGVSFITYENYGKVVSDLKTALYGA